MLNLMHEHRPFMTEVVQKLLKKGGYGDINAEVGAVDACKSIRGPNGHFVG